jgi:hypothetical protein
MPPGTPAPVHTAKSSDRVGELLFRGGGQAARRYSLITSHRLSCAIGRTCPAAGNDVCPYRCNSLRNPSTYVSNGSRTLAQYGMLTVFTPTHGS